MSVLGPGIAAADYARPDPPPPGGWRANRLGRLPYRGYLICANGDACILVDDDAGLAEYYRLVYRKLRPEQRITTEVVLNEAYSLPLVPGRRWLEGTEGGG